MENYSIKKETLTNVANAIREKTGEEGEMTPLEMPEKIKQIQTEGNPYVLPVASEETLGGVKASKKTNQTKKAVVDDEGYIYVDDYPTKLPNPQTLTFKGAATGTYDGSSSLEITIPSGDGDGGEFDINTATPSFTEAQSRENINTGETIPILFGKIKKWFTDLKAVAFSGNYSDLTGQPQALKNPQAITFTGAVSETYDGSEAKTINIPTGGAGTTDYNELLNRPSIDGVTIEDDKSASDYGLATKDELPKQATDTVAGIAKFKPIAEQGNNVPASILPNGTVVVPPGGSSSGVGYTRLVETIAEGTIAEGLPIYSFTDTGVSIPEILKQWKVFFVELYTTEANNWYLHAEQNNNKPNITLPAQKVCYVVRTFEQLEEGVNTVKVYGYYSTGAGQYYTKYSPDVGLSVQSNISDIGFHNFEGTDHFYIRNYGAETTVAAQWRIVGIIKKEMKP